MRRFVLWVLIVIAAVVAAGVGWMYFAVQRPYRGYDAPEQFVEIPRGSSTGAIARRLADAGIVRDQLAFRIAVYTRNAGGRLQAGEYRFDRPMTAAEVVDKLRRGDVYLVSITFREGLSIRQMAQLFESKGLGKAADFVTAASDGTRIHALDPEARDLEGYLFPDTYAMPRRTT
ncbi:MAG TPA: endolytic transglycosylase MltG, partial [Vicinamibacterales bacterium]|nr:endolytic transglycosylase MltG [Vicinamibacterales bacterium]